MAYCPKCGTKNDDDAKVCIKCGEKLHLSSKEAKPKGDTCFGPSERRGRPEQECFGIPRLGPIIGVAIGLLILLFGAGLIISRYYGVQIEIWPMAVVIFGIIVVIVAISALRRRG